MSGMVQPAVLAPLERGLAWGEWHFDATVGILPYGGGTSLVLDEHVGAINDMTSDGQHAFWAVHGFGDTDGAIRVSTQTGAKTAIAGLTRPGGVAFHGGHIFATSGYGPPFGDGVVVRADANGKNAVTLADGLETPWAVAVNASGVYFTDPGDVMIGVKPRLMRTGIEPHTDVAVLAEGNIDFGRIAVDDQRVYFAVFSKSGSMLQSVAHDGGPPEQIGAFAGGVGDIALDASGLYWVAAEDTALPPTLELWWRSPSGKATVLATGPWPIRRIALDSVAVYFAYFDGDGTGGVMRICKP
jgi:hypothetical protein